MKKLISFLIIFGLLGQMVMAAPVEENPGPAIGPGAGTTAPGSGVVPDAVPGTPGPAPTQLDPISNLEVTPPSAEIPSLSPQLPESVEEFLEKIDVDGLDEQGDFDESGSDEPETEDSSETPTNEEDEPEDDSDETSTPDEEEEPVLPEPSETKASSDPWRNLQGFQNLMNYDLFTGEANLSFPFMVPEGRNGFTPSLSMNYSSFNNKYVNPYGFGFDLSHSSIYRTSNHGIGQMYDRNDFAVKLSGKYSELVLVDAGTGLYMEKVANGPFTKYYFQNNVWRVEDTAGNAYFFEYNNNNFQWMLTRAETALGQVERIEYEYFTDHNYVYLDKIKYAFSGTTHFYEIDLSYSSKSKSATDYRAGFVLKNYKMLSSIAVKYREGGGLVTAREYHFSYDDLNKASPLLTQIHETGAGLNLPAINFDYYGNGVTANLLKTVRNNQGGEIAMEYLSSIFYRDPQTGAANRMPFMVKTLSAIEHRDLIRGVTSTKEFNYSGGHYYYDFENVFDREYAGFYKVTVTDDAGYVNRQYFHQSEFSDDVSTTLGEFTDDISKKSRPFRVETYDNAGNLMKLNLTKWKQETYTAVGDERYFVYPEKTIEADFSGGVTKLKGKYNQYSLETGNIYQEYDYGEISANLSPSSGTPYDTIADIGNDTIIAVHGYAEPVGARTNFISARFLTKIYDDEISEANKVSLNQIIYDEAPYGEIDKGNVTWKQAWLKSNYAEAAGSGTAVVLENQDLMINLEHRTYGGSCANYGLPSSVADLMGNVTNYQYDNYCLYPAKIIYPATQNEAGQTIVHEEEFVYDYRSGQVKEFTDQNNHLFKKEYDVLGRPIKEYVPDGAGGVFLKIEIYNNDTSAVHYQAVKLRDREDLAESDPGAWHYSYKYFDGFGRVIQEKAETETQWSVVDYRYDSHGNIINQTYPKFTGASSYEATVSGAPQTKFYYDGLDRVIKSEQYRPNGVIYASSSIYYIGWMQKHSDMGDRIKKQFYDARGRLLEVKEYYNNGSEIFSTEYEYNPLGQITKITDAEGNIREMRYDTLGRRIALTDLHYSSKVNWGTDFGVTYYKYDNQGNLVGTNRVKTDDDTDEVIYEYDGLNRITKEDLYAPQSVVEKQYFYDGPINGVGRLSKGVTKQFAQNGIFVKTEKSYEYTCWGNVKKEIVDITSQVGTDGSYEKSATYDVLGRVKNITLPGNYRIRYEFNPSMSVEKVFKQKSGEAEIALISNIDYSPMGQVTRIDNTNATSTVNTYDPNEMYRLKTKVTTVGGTTKAQDLTYSYDRVGNVTDVIDNSQNSLKKNVSYEYDDLYRLTSVTVSGSTAGNYTRTYQYSPTGNITYKSDMGTYKYPAEVDPTSPASPHAVMQIENGGQVVREFEYDANGNMAEEKIYENGVMVLGKSYLYNYANQLKKATTVVPSSGMTANEVYATAAAYWKFNEAGGRKLYDSSGNNKIAATMGATRVPGRKGKALEFNGIDQYVETPLDVQPSAMPEVTFSAWIKPTQLNHPDWQQVISSDDGYWDRAIMVARNTPNWGASTGWVVWEPVAANANEWQHVVAVYSNDNLIFYKNGEKFPLGQAPTTATTIHLMDIGRCPNDEHYFKGFIDDVAVFDRALTDQEVAALYDGSPYPDINVTSMFYDAEGNRVVKWDNKNSHFNIYPFEGYEMELDKHGGGVDVRKSWGVLAGNLSVFRETETVLSDGFDAVEYVEDVVGVDLGEGAGSGDGGGAAAEVGGSAAGSPEPASGATSVAGGGSSATAPPSALDSPRMGNVNGEFYFHTDHLGSSSVVTNRYGGVVQVVDYFPYGFVRLEETSQGYENDYLYTGKERDEEFGLYYYGARYYGAEVGRFVSVDPAVKAVGTPQLKKITQKKTQEFLKDPQTLNEYAYGRNNPVVYVDPTGEMAAEAGALGLSLYLIPGVGQIAAVLSIGAVGILAIYGIIELGQTTQQNIDRAYGNNASLNENIFNQDANNPESGAAVNNANKLKQQIAGGSQTAGPGGQEPEDPYDVAKSGGKHYGTYDTYKNKSISNIKSAIKSFDKQIQSHQRKIANPSKYVKNWGTRSVQYRQGIQNRWRVEINNFREQKSIMKGIIRSKVIK